MNNKAILLAMYTTIALLIWGTQFFFVLNERQLAVQAEGSLGERALHVVELEQEHQRILTFIDASASLALDQAITDLYTQNTKPCGAYTGIPYWRGPENKQTLAACAVHPKTFLTTELQRILPHYLTLYPGQPLTSSYSFLYTETRDYLVVTGTSFEPIETRTHRETTIPYWQTLIVHPTFTVMKLNPLGELEELRSEAEAILRRCQGQEDVDTCAHDYLKESTDIARKHGVTYTLLSGKSCTEEDQPADRSVTFCKHTLAGTISFALFFSSSIPLDITTFTVKPKNGAPADWLTGNHVLGINKGEAVSLHVELTTPDVASTVVELCSSTCTLLWKDGPEQDTVVGAIDDKNHLSFDYTFTPSEEGPYTVKTSYLVNDKVDQEASTLPTNKIFITKPKNT